MVQINKTGKRPAILVSSGADIGKDKLLLETEELKAEYLKDPAAYNSGTKKFSFKSDLYAHEKIKSGLLKIQHGKCCFCESRIPYNEDKISNTGGDVEHFRPKTAWTIKPDRNFNYPGYYWLAYDWGNLFFACIRCNQRIKRNMFPLDDESKRALNHTYRIEDEEPLFIHPEKIDPEEHITFQEAFITPKNGSLKGEATIKKMKLEQFYENRKELHDKIKGLIDLYNMIPDPVSEIPKAYVIDVLRNTIDPKHQYLNMIRSNFGDDIQKILNDAV